MICECYMYIFKNINKYKTKQISTQKELVWMGKEGRWVIAFWAIYKDLFSICVQMF